MSTSHLCNGKWRPGPVKDCPKHTRLSKKQKSVYSSGDKRPGGSSGSGGGESSGTGSKDG